MRYVLKPIKLAMKAFAMPRGHSIGGSSPPHYLIEVLDRMDAVPYVHGPYQGQRIWVEPGQLVGPVADDDAVAVARGTPPIPQGSAHLVHILEIVSVV